MIELESMRRLAPSNLPVYVDVRYDGGGQSASLDDFSREDSNHLRILYQAVRELYLELKVLASTKTITALEVINLKGRSHSAIAMNAARSVGRGSMLSPHLASTLHDVRGGSLLALLATLEILQPQSVSPDGMLRLFCYARDHLKIMRNAIPDIDPGAASHDREPSPHEIKLLREKWAGGQFSIGEDVKSVRFEASFDGPIANRCMEFSALDRIIYNLMNNAARHGDGPEVALNIFSTGDAAGAAVRFVVQNQVREAHRQVIAAASSDKLGNLFRGGFTTGGSGLGLKICADFIVRAFGLKSGDQAVAEGYIGAVLIRDVFVVWFHWPRV